MSALQAPPTTWIDVARRLALVSVESLEIPAKIYRARIAWYGLTLEVAAGTAETEVFDWLEKIFPNRTRAEPLRLELEGPAYFNELPVEIIVGDPLPDFRQSFGIVDGTIEFHSRGIPNQGNRPSPIVAALSVKGGTGRTTSAIAFALRWAAKAGKPVLLIDADLEAPGISYLFEAHAGVAKVSLEDIITLAHSEEDPTAPQTVDFASERLRDHAIGSSLFVLPLRRDIDELTSSAVRPEHLSTPERPFALADILSAIAAKLGCVGAVVDVRAGLVPLGVNLAMDPNVSPIFVTTLADQSIRATGALVQFLSREMRRFGGALRKPLLIVNRVPVVFKQTGMDQRLTEPLIASLLTSLLSEKPSVLSASESVFDELSDIEPFIQVDIPELPDMQISARGWSEFIAQISGSGFDKIIGPGIDQWIATELETGRPATPEIGPLVPASTPDISRQQLGVYAEQLIAAENATGGVPKPLVTQPLAALAQRFQSEVPIAVSEGAKGTGKTLAARYFISQGQWDVTVSALGGRSDAIRGAIVPVCASIQSSSKFQTEVDDARNKVSTEMGFGNPLNVYETTAWLKEQIGLNHSEQIWVGLWLDIIAWSVGLNVRQTGAGEVLLEKLRSSGKQIVALLEGLEELYTAVSDTGVDSAMRAALVSLPQRLRSEARRPLGVIVFVRRDTVEAAVKQNLDQYRREYHLFALSWTEDDVLELAAWLTTQSNALPDLWFPAFSILPFAEKALRLESLWGKKLGPDDVPGKRTREAYTATWVIAVLSDLRGRLVPRDLVRLLASAAAVQPDGEERTTYQTRLLVPRALKKAVEPTSSAKVKETEEEISELAPVFAKFKLKTNEIVAPLSAEALATIGIDNAELQLLIKHGIVFGDTQPYEVPELFRLGLGLRHAGARRSVVNLYRKARP
ncbi:hypothetical protein HFO98_14320 [Rhizobium leguminosarum]|uniref:KGGVGR-motif variant AAA ATPase n=1 Tax=Rhizobium leguminosarum TaxID=384 RepID=UPI001C982EBA|nr:hypothetical protein [Rhizobium leguminosarum]MBY5409619.1 hypothetical protein [Rhizobium leguminosarum]